MTIPQAPRPRVRYASRGAPGPPEKATKKTPIPISNQGARKPTISMRARMLPVHRTPLGRGPGAVASALLGPSPAGGSGAVAELELATHPVERVPDQA